VAEQAALGDALRAAHDSSVVAGARAALGAAAAGAGAAAVAGPAAKTEL
jgi:hypothetical protein